ncbi:dhbF [Symbiodinium natans]|uniref:DhbF protein n=1 Tax=Symbiodinium natans TaxID=878477 RepID=A0A812PQB0_9DINO|nr:dhbF [Symbiodinium natans]
MKRRMAPEAAENIFDNAKRPCMTVQSAEEAVMEEEAFSFAGLVGLDEAFDRLAKRYPQRPAVEDDFGCAWTYSELQEASLRLASGFLEMMSVKGDSPPIVALLLRRSCLWVASCLAASRLGPVLALSCDLETQEEVTRNTEALAEHRPRLLVLEHAVCDAAAAAPLKASHASGTPLVFADTLQNAEVQWVHRPQAWGPRHLDDALWLVYTGGTTAASKCVVQTHRMALHELVTYPDFGVMTCEDRILHHTSAFWGATSLGLFDLPWSCGACLVLLARHGIAEVAQAIEERRITVAGLVPSLLDALSASRCTSLRTVFTWGEALRPSTAAAWCRHVQLLDLLIASEYWLVLCADHRQTSLRQPGFFPVRGAQLVLLAAQLEEDDTTSPQHVAPGEVGELYIAGPMVSAQGYSKAALNEGAFVNLPLGAGGQLVRHYRTRDLARWTANGALEYCGRADGFAKVGGKWLDLTAVERRLQEAGCKEAALLWDEEHKVRHAAVVLRDGKLECSLAAQVTQLEAVLPPHTSLHLLRSLPKNPATGKVARAALLKDLRQKQEDHCILSGSSPSSSSKRPRPPKSPVSRSLLLGLVLAAGLRRGRSQAGHVPLALALAPGLLELIWQGNCDEPSSKSQNRPETNGANGAKGANGANGAQEMGTQANGHVSGAGRGRRSLVPRGVAERLTSWLTWYRSIALLLSPEQLDALPFICLLLIDGSQVGLAGFVRVVQGPLGLLGCGALLAASSLPSTWLLAAAGRLWARRARGGSGWLWVFWLGFPSLADTWSGAVWSTWPRGAPCCQGAWQAMQGILAALQAPGEERHPELSRCSHCWDWVATSTCTIWRRRTYCSDCTEGWESYQATLRMQMGEESQTELTPRSDASYWTSTPSGTPSGTPATTPRNVDAAQAGSAAAAASSLAAGAIAPPRKKSRSAVDVIDFAEYEVSLAKSRRPRPEKGETVQQALSTSAAEGNSRSKVAQVLERSTGLQGSRLSGLESLKVIILVRTSDWKWKTCENNLAQLSPRLSFQHSKDRSQSGKHRLVALFIRLVVGIPIASAPGAGEVLQCETLQDLEALVEAWSCGDVLLIHPLGHPMESAVPSAPVLATFVQMLSSRKPDAIGEADAGGVGIWERSVSFHGTLRQITAGKLQLGRLLPTDLLVMKSQQTCLGAASVLVVLRALLGVPEMGRGPALSAGAGRGLASLLRQLLVALRFVIEEARPTSLEVSLVILAASSCFQLLLAASCHFQISIQGKFGVERSSSFFVGSFLGRLRTSSGFASKTKQTCQTLSASFSAIVDASLVENGSLEAPCSMDEGRLVDK